MWASSMKIGYIVTADENLVTIYDTLEEAQSHIQYQKEKIHSTKHWSIIHIKDLEWL